MTVFLLIVAVGLGVLLVMVLMPKNLKKIDGYPAELATEEPRNLLKELQVALDPKNEVEKVELTEAEINTYLNQRIGGKQGGALSFLVKYQGVYADLEPGYAEFFVVRSVVGIPFTVSTKLTQKESGYTTVWRAGGGSIGRIQLGKKQFKPIVDAFLRMRIVLKDEIDAIKAMEKVEFGQDKVAIVR